MTGWCGQEYRFSQTHTNQSRVTRHDSSVTKIHSALNKIIHIDFERTGGFTGIPDRVILDDSLLSPDELEEVRQLIERSDFFSLQATDSSEKSMPDQFLYQITVKTTEFSHTLIIYEQEVTTHLRPLIRFLSEKTRRGRKK